MRLEAMNETFNERYTNFNVDVFHCGGGETYDLLKTL